MTIKIISIAVMLLGLGIGFWQYQILSKSIIVEGVVTDFTMGRTGKKKKRTTYGVIAQFKDSNGSEFEYRANWKTTNPGYEVGDKIKLYYSESNPANNGVCSFGTRFGISYILFYLGAAALLFSLSWPWLSNLFNSIYIVSHVGVE